MPIQVHTSFLLLIGWVILSGESDASDTFTDVAFLCAVFFCILLHECGHVFVGQSYGVKTRDITLYPFGGVATLLSQPTPRQEFFIAIAGPIVSLAIAGALYLIIDDTTPFLSELARTNLALALFNLIPAIPMDGGRVFRSLLAMLRIKSATAIAARVSQLCSILLCGVGLYIHAPILVIISIFVFFGAVQELVYTQTKHAVSTRVARDLMIEREKLFCFQHATTLTEAIKIALRSLQELFPVLYNDELLGLVSRQALIEAVSISGDEHYLAGLAERDIPWVTPETPLDLVVKLSDERRTDVIAVVEDGRFIGLVFMQNVSDIMLIETFKKERRDEEASSDIDPELL